jgi:hypothetical protein
MGQERMTKMRRAAGNSTLAIGAVSCSKESIVVTESSVLRINKQRFSTWTS